MNRLSKSVIVTLIVFFQGFLFGQEKILPTISTEKPIKTISWDKDSSSFAYAEDNKIIVRSASDYSLLQSIETDNGNLLFLSFTQSTEGDGQNQLATLSEQDVLEYRVLPQRAPIHTTYQELVSTPTTLAYSYNGNYIATANETGRIQIYLQNYVTQTFIARTIGNLNCPIYSLYFSRDNKYLLASTADEKAYVFEVASGDLLKELPYYSAAKTPVFISHNSQYLISATAKDKVIIYDMESNPLRSIETIFPITSMKLTADGAKLIILTEDNIFRLYDIFTAQLLYFIPAFNGTPITSFAFNNITSRLIICHEDGNMYIINVEDSLVTYAKKEEPTNEEELPEDNLLYKKGHGAIVNLGFMSLPSPFTVGLMLDTGYLNYDLLQPFYVGGFLKPYFGFPGKSFPLRLTDTNTGNTIKNPFLAGIKIYFPAGFSFYPFENEWEIFAEVQAGFSLNMIWNGKFDNTGISSKLTPSFYGGAKLGFCYKILTCSVTCEYDVIYGFNVSTGVGVTINIGGRKTAEQIAEAKEKAEAKANKMAEKAAAKEEKSKEKTKGKAKLEEKEGDE